MESAMCLVGPVKWNLHFELFTYTHLHNEQLTELNHTHTFNAIKSFHFFWKNKWLDKVKLVAIKVLNNYQESTVVAVYWHCRLNHLSTDCRRI